jgi:hypothetical protein
MASAVFHRYIGIDYSGAATPESRLPGLRVFMASEGLPPEEIRPKPDRRQRHWSRRILAHWLANRLREAVLTLVGIDHGFSFPLQYVQAYGLSHDWSDFLDDFQAFWPTDQPGTRVEDLRQGRIGNGKNRQGDARWRRLAERRTSRAKSVFHFDVPGSVAKSTHAGLPWLRFLRQQAGRQIHWWPFDGWDVPAGKSVVAEVYPSLWSGSLPQGPHTQDQHDALCATLWLQQTDLQGAVQAAFHPTLDADEKAAAHIEGWILGVG